MRFSLISGVIGRSNQITVLVCLLLFSHLEICDYKKYSNRFKTIVHLYNFRWFKDNLNFVDPDKNAAIWGWVSSYLLLDIFMIILVISY